MFSSSEDHFTSAEKLLSMFDNLIADGEEMSYLALTHSMTSGLHIKLPKGRPSKAINDPCKFTRNLMFYQEFLLLITKHYSQRLHLTNVRQHECTGNKEINAHI